MSIRKLMRMVGRSEDASGTADDGDATANIEGTDTIFNRRNVLRGIAAGSATTVMGSGSVSASEEVSPKIDLTEEERRDIIEPYNDIETARRAVKENVTAVLGELATEGYLESANLSALGIDRLPEMGPDKRHEEGILVSGIKKKEADEYSSLIEVWVNSDKHRIKFTVNPDADVVNAKVLKQDGSIAFETTNLSVSSSSCSWYCGTSFNGDWIGYCSWNCACEWCGSWCSGDYELYHIYECDGTDLKKCCPGEAECESNLNTQCTHDCDCGEECNCSECC